MLRRLLPILLTAVVIAIGVAALVVRPATGAPQHSADYAILVGVAGLRWDDVDPQRTPTLWRMAEQGSIGSLSVRSARRPTCPVDGWLTLGAGNYAAWDGNPVTGSCPKTNVMIEEPDGIGANLPGQPTAVQYNKEKLAWGAVPGALAESVRCTAAVGPGAAVAAARPFGRVDQYKSTLPADPASMLSSCVLSIIDLGTITGEDPDVRAAAARRADAELARVLAARPNRSLVIVAGLADTDQTSRLHVVLADGPGFQGGWLASASTGRDGYVQLVDLAPTALAALGRPKPEGLFIGNAASMVRDRSGDLPEAVQRPVDADREAGAQRRIDGWFFALLAAVQLVLAVAVVPLLRRARRHAGPVGPAPVSRRVVAVVEVLLIAAALVIPSALVADAIPWWRGAYAGLYFTLATLVLLGVGTVGVRLARGYGGTLGPLGVVAGLTAVVVGIDVVTGARLQLNGVAGYSALDGGRYAGLGIVGLGVFVAGTLLSAGWLAQRVRRSWRPAVMVLVGGVGVIIVGSPYLGADAVGAIALTAGVSIAAAISTGGWLTLGRLAWATIAGLAVTVCFALFDVRRPTGERSGLGRFLAAVGDGTGGLTIHRSGQSNMQALAGSPLTVLAIVGAVLVWFALLQDWGGLKRLFGIYPALRAAMAGIAVASLLGGLLGGSALNVAGAAAALTVPMAALAALRVLDHATDRTRPATLDLPAASGSRPVAVHMPADPAGARDTEPTSGGGGTARSDASAGAGQTRGETVERGAVTGVEDASAAG